MKFIIALGANLGDREQTFERAIARIGEEVGSIESRSANFETAPLVLEGVDPTTIPSYLNGVIKVDSVLSPDAVLSRLLMIEREFGRDRELEAGRWQSRTLDLDLIAAENLVVATPSLSIPHPEMHRRRFVLEPMVTIEPDWRHPQLGMTTRELYSRIIEHCGADRETGMSG